MPPIPASFDVSVKPGVVPAGGSALTLNAVILTDGLLPPVGYFPGFPDQAAVQAYFGVGSPEAQAAQVYFDGFAGSTRVPGQLYLAQYNIAAVAGYLLGGSLGSMTLTQLQAINASLTVSIDGTPYTGAVNLAAATSFSNAATIIQTALGHGVVTWNPNLAAFQVTSGTTGSSSTVSLGTGAAAPLLALTAATGAIVSPGEAAPTSVTPAAFMNNLVAGLLNWAGFTLTWDPGLAVREEFAQWANSRPNQDFLYSEWDSDANAAISNPVTLPLGLIALQNHWNGTVYNYDPVAPMQLGVFALAVMAGLNFQQPRGRATWKFRTSPDLLPGVTSSAVLSALIANGYNCYAQFATKTEFENYYTPGQVPGEWDWVDEFVNQIWLNDSLQAALLAGMKEVLSIPYNTEGAGTLKSFCLPVITQFGAFGGFATGVALDQEQIALVNAQAQASSGNPGLTIDGQLSTQGYYLLIGQASSAVRSARQTPPCWLWYTDGGSVQQIALNSIDVQ